MNEVKWYIGNKHLEPMGHSAPAARLENSPLQSYVCLGKISELSEEQRQKHDVKWDAVKNREVGIQCLLAAEYGAHNVLRVREGGRIKRGHP
ncbi:hypothetical protein FOQG_00155 [Fusarium oxysporum f. sp. raphani 54005]|uniref:Uncharacterized protein n=2 Tax=Fusarium oxysporum TaxID=5507 RepID=X0CYZ0_FUSOX|nr:hypothetical protein FOVG_03416 [Fusarium oxysporum f. sp. pisi HDV247]EXK99720.1 hypothetical protein FOQG_00155 [Fusarium oxysporum f. sp. raphani 54005]